MEAQRCRHPKRRPDETVGKSGLLNVVQVHAAEDSHGLDSLYMRSHEEFKVEMLSGSLVKGRVQSVLSRVGCDAAHSENRVEQKSPTRVGTFSAHVAVAELFFI